MTRLILALIIATVSYGCGGEPAIPFKLVARASVNAKRKRRER
ncbi:hypothetical protein FB461_2415 [Rarobacter faecitabidus]|uniref:Lipoprotein n=1 Tax=Rarobacter faecitabidus TaxID=13243 RepID=A0A542Z875_RARFA|nr:hypothetical protein FB461_2415 [Rarobacter faecitabidus]